MRGKKSTPQKRSAVQVFLLKHAPLVVPAHK